MRILRVSGRNATTKAPDVVSVVPVSMLVECNQAPEACKFAKVVDVPQQLIATLGSAQERPVVEDEMLPEVRKFLISECGGKVVLQRFAHLFRSLGDTRTAGEANDSPMFGQQDVDMSNENEVAKHTPASADIFGLGGASAAYLQQQTPTKVVPPGCALITIRHPSVSCDPDVPPSESTGVVWAAPRLPSTCSFWFAVDRVSDVERELVILLGLAEGQYQTLRNDIYYLYIAQPSKHLSVKDVVAALGGADSADIVRVWSLLDFFGVINFSADRSLSKRYCKRLVDLPVEAVGNVQGSSACDRRICVSCSNECRYMYFRVHRSRVQLLSDSQYESLVFCRDCVEAGRLPSFFERKDLEHVDLELYMTKTGQSDWTEMETVRLVEGLEWYGGDWFSVAHHVGGGRSPAACLLRFCSLGIQDSVSGKRQSNEPRSDPALALKRRHFGGSNALRDESQTPILPILVHLANQERTSQQRPNPTANESKVTINDSIINALTGLSGRSLDVVMA